MNKQALTDGLAAMIAQDRPPEAKIFLSLLKEVWEIDWTVAPYDVFIHYVQYDVPYFWRFMSMDSGDEMEEQDLITDWVRSRHSMGSFDKRAMMDLMDEANELRHKAR